MAAWRSSEQHNDIATCLHRAHNLHVSPWSWWWCIWLLFWHDFSSTFPLIESSLATALLTEHSASQSLYLEMPPPRRLCLQLFPWFIPSLHHIPVQRDPPLLPAHKIVPLKLSIILNGSIFFIAITILWYYIFILCPTWDGKLHTGRYLVLCKIIFVD